MAAQKGVACESTCTEYYKYTVISYTRWRTLTARRVACLQYTSQWSVTHTPAIRLPVYYTASTAAANSSYSETLS